MTCDGAYADHQDFASFWNVTCHDSSQEIAFDRILKLSAADIHAARAAAGGCDCGLASWALDMLKKLNCILAAVTFPEVCGIGFSAEERRVFMDWADRQLRAIRVGDLELCAGETGGDYPAMGAAEMSLTEFSAARIAANRLLRRG